MFYYFIGSMKKYFLLIALLTVVFLWLGNYSFAAVTCDDNKTICDSVSQCNCDNYTLDPTESCTCASTCNGIWVDDWYWKSCCDATCQSLRTSMLWDPCDSPKNGVRKWWITSFICTCPSGTKNIDNVCEPCNKKWVCCGISLNTSIPFIGKCIEDSAASVGPDETWVTWSEAFPVLMWSLTKILVTLILIISFVLIIIGGIMIATGNPSWGKKMITNVIIGIALLGASGVILRLINPNFFG